MWYTYATVLDYDDDCGEDDVTILVMSIMLLVIAVK